MEVKHLKHYTPWQIAVLLSGISLGFGAVRELMIAAMLGFGEKNDALQACLSIIYVTSLNIDAIRLSCLNLYLRLSLFRMVLFCLGIGTACSVVTCFFMTQGQSVSFFLLAITVAGSMLHLLSVLLITFRQQQDLFLPAQIINVTPNILLIPGIACCYFFLPAAKLVEAIVVLVSLVPALQCCLLARLKGGIPQPAIPQQAGWFATLRVFAKHGSAVLGEQAFQVITRTAFLTAGPGWLSLYALILRLYAALRFVLIDSWIGSKLHAWKQQAALPAPSRSTVPAGLLIAAITLAISLQGKHTLTHAAVQTFFLLSAGFYFTALLRVAWFRLNQHHSSAPPLLRFALYEMGFACLAFLLAREANCPVIALLWLGYIAKPFFQCMMVSRHQVRKA